MKNRLFSGLLLVAALVTGLVGASRDAQWQKVEKAQNNGLPKSAIEALEPIIAGALADRNYPEAIKALGRKLALEGNIQGNKPEEQIIRMNAALAGAPAEMKPVLEAILARWYWHYFQHNRWRFMQRTQTAAPPGEDFQTWDLARILAEVDVHFTAALAGDKILKATPVSAYNDLLPAGNVPDAYRPTLYDFLAHEALEFYQAGEHGTTRAEDSFELDASSPALGNAEEFSRWQPASADATSPVLKALRLYQSLLKFHEADRDRSAFLDVDLARLTWAHNVAVGENKDERFKAALEQFVAGTAKHEISARGLAALAGQLQAEGDPAKAHELATRGYQAFPESAGGATCYNLIQQIEAKSAQLVTDHVWNAPWPTLDVTYRNVTRVYFRALPMNFTDYLSKVRWNYGNIDPEMMQDSIRRIAPALAWEAELPATKDFKDRTESIPAPSTLKPGYYFIVASHDPSFATENNQVSIAPVWVSDLALVTMQRRDGRATSGSGFVLRAGSGDPIEGATVQIWQQDRQGEFRQVDRVRTDENGRFQYSARNQNSGSVLLAEFEGHAVATAEQLHNYGQANPRPALEQTVFFTDRALYRPGQTVSYKGISLRHHQASASYDTLADRKLTVSFRDANGKEIARATHTTNAYGSFSGSFTAPRDRVMGRMSLWVDGGPNGQAFFNVEEYKRPKFQVELKPPAQAAKLDAPAELTGTATAYTGAAIGGAKVKWRVTRAVQFPYWCWWFQPPETKAIAHGTAVSEPDGTFKVEFVAAPDRSVPEKNEPVFSYIVHADVTDSTGETRSAEHTIRAGYTALQATVAAGEWQVADQPVKFTVTTESLDDVPQSAQGTVSLHALQQPLAVQRAARPNDYRPWRRFAGTEPKPDPANPDSWALGDLLTKLDFKTDATGKTEVSAKLAPGVYRASLETKDRFGRKVTARQTVNVVDPAAKRYGVKLANHFAAPKWSVEPGDTFTALWGTGYDRGRAYVELGQDGKTLRSYWTASDRTQEIVEVPITEDMRGGITVQVTYVRENRAYLNQRIVDVPWSNKQLAVKWESFRSKLLPGQNETWTAVITGPDAKRASAEMVATLYDASLDQFAPHNWMKEFGVFRREWIWGTPDFQNHPAHFRPYSGWNVDSRIVEWNYRDFPQDISADRWGWDYFGNDQVIALGAFAVRAAPAGGYAEANTLAGTRVSTELRDMAAAAAPMAKGVREDAAPAVTVATPPPPDLDKVSARKNLNETAFFFPHLLAGDDGLVKIQFTMPEALTEWKFFGFAHDAKLRAGFLTDKVVTTKDLMIEPNPPRFVREGDAIEFTVKVSNQSDQPQSGKVRLTFADATTLQAVDAALGNDVTEQAFDVPAKQSRSYSWRIAVPDGMDFLTYKAVGATATASDGEEGFLPVLSRRILVTESLPLPIRGKVTKEFAFTKLIDSGKSDTLKHQSLTVQMVSQPAWYAVMALPYLMEYPHQCSEQLFNRLYANTLARHIANSDPKIRRIFDLWKNTPALDSPLMKNQDLKSVMIEETPWLRQANRESESRRNVGLLFDANRLDEETSRILQELADRQLNEGLWSWFPGGRPSEYISLYITTGFGRLRHLGANIDIAPAVKSLNALDAWMDRRYREILRLPDPDKYVPSYLDAFYLYGRSFFLEDRPVASQNREAVDFFLRQSRKHWLKVDSRMSTAHLALALQRFGDKDTPQAIMKSLKERSVTNEEMGMFWRETELSWWWYRAPIETQAMMIEAFAEVAQDAQAVEDCKVWLLKQKQTQDWKTTKATADAVYGLLLRGDNLLSSDALVEVALAGETIKPEKVEAGTGFYEQKFVRGEIKPAMGHVTVKKVDDGVSWGSVHWQYLEDMGKVTPHEGTPLRLKKALFIKETTKSGQVLKPVSGPVGVGDELVVRIELRTDRDMEYVHLKDQRGSGTEPVNVLSRYKFQDGLAYYESTRDTASHFFIDYLPKGTYVFEYSTRVQLKGRYQTGIAEIQCMYAPEFNSHSASLALEVK